MDLFDGGLFARFRDEVERAANGRAGFAVHTPARLFHFHAAGSANEGDAFTTARCAGNVAPDVLEIVLGHTSPTYGRSVGFWQDLKKWLTPSYVERQAQVLHDVLDENEDLRKEVGRLRKRNSKLEQDLERLKAGKEAESQRLRLLAEQAKRCRCRN